MGTPATRKVQVSDQNETAPPNGHNSAQDPPATLARTTLGRFAAGHSGNPSGRKRGLAARL